MRAALTALITLLFCGCVDGDGLGIPGATDRVFECAAERAGETFQVELCFDGDAAHLQALVVAQEPGVVSAACRPSGRACVQTCPNDPATDWQCNAEHGCYCAR